MEKIETEVVLVPGSALMAPVYKPIDCDAPPWSGRIVYDLKQEDIESVYTFCMEDAWDLGYEDGVYEKEERTAPVGFRPRFLLTGYGPSGKIIGIFISSVLYNLSF